MVKTITLDGLIAVVEGQMTRHKKVINALVGVLEEVRAQAGKYNHGPSRTEELHRLDMCLHHVNAIQRLLSDTDKVQVDDLS